MIWFVEQFTLVLWWRYHLLCFYFYASVLVHSTFCNTKTCTCYAKISESNARTALITNMFEDYRGRRCLIFIFQCNLLHWPLTSRWSRLCPSLKSSLKTWTSEHRWVPVVVSMSVSLTACTRSYILYIIHPFLQEKSTIRLIVPTVTLYVIENIDGKIVIV